MTIAQVQPLNIPTASELTKAHDFLHEADLLVTDVKSLFRNSGDFVIAARLKDIQGRLADEIQAIERLIAASKPGLRHRTQRDCFPHVNGCISARVGAQSLSR
jgi:hypothetical protein